MHSSPRTAAIVAAGAALVAGRLLAARLELGPVDDAYISLRYAAHLAAGEGLVFNPGERVEGFTNLLLVLLEAAAIRLGLRPEAAMGTFGWAALAALGALAAHFAARRIFRAGWLAAACVGVGVALDPVLLCWAGSGMETVLYAALVLAAAILSSDESERGRPLALAVVFLLAVMTRPEAVALLPVLLVGVGRWRRPSGAASLAAIGVGGVAALTAWRWLYFGEVLPNTFYAKLDYGSVLLAQRGAAYVGRFVAAVWPIAVAAAALGVRLRGAPRWVGVFLALAVVQSAVVVYEGGDHFAAFRFMAPVWPLLALLAMVAFVRLGELGQRLAVRRGARPGVQRVAGPWPARVAALAAVAALSLSGVGIARAVRPYYGPESELERFVREVALARHWGALGRLLANRAPHGASLASAAIGAVGYESGLRIVDPHGIVDPVVARLDRKLGTGYAGHEKFDVDALLARRPDIVSIVGVPTPRPLGEARIRALAWGGFGRALVRHPVFSASYRLEAVRDGELFWNLHVRRDRPRLDGGGPA